MQRCNNKESGKACSGGREVHSLFLGLEKRKLEKCFIKELITEEGKKLDKTEEILDEVEHFYQEFFPVKVWKERLLRERWGP